MSARHEELVPNDDESFYIGVFQDNIEKITWHYHNTYEICFITEGSGKRIVGDSIREFHPGDLVFIGRNLPHTWLAEKELSAWSNRTLEMVYLQFSPAMLSHQLLLLPEFKNIKKALDQSERGIQIVDQTLNEVSEIMLQLPYLKSFDRMIQFFRLMDIIGSSATNVPLASEEYIKKRFLPANKRIGTLHDHLMSHYREEIDLARLASLVNMAQGSLCRLFKNQMGVTLFEYLIRIKVEFACKLLMDPDLSIVRVCMDSGFNNLSHFNKQFLKNMGVTPSLYRKNLRLQK